MARTPGKAVIELAKFHQIPGEGGGTELVGLIDGQRAVIRRDAECGKGARLGKELLGHGDTGLVWAAWCQAHPGPHVPVIHVCHVITHDGCRVGFVGIIERLATADEPVLWLAADRTLKRDPLRLAAIIAPARPSLAGLLRAAAAAFPAGHFDMAPSNWMQRRCGTLVLTDPLSRAG